MRRPFLNALHVRSPKFRYVLPYGDNVHWNWANNGLNYYLQYYLTNTRRGNKA